MNSVLKEKKKTLGVSQHRWQTSARQPRRYNMQTRRPHASRLISFISTSGEDNTDGRWDYFCYYCSNIFVKCFVTQLSHKKRKKSWSWRAVVYRVFLQRSLHHVSAAPLGSLKPLWAARKLTQLVGGSWGHIHPRPPGAVQIVGGWGGYWGRGRWILNARLLWWFEEVFIFLIIWASGLSMSIEYFQCKTAMQKNPELHSNQTSFVRGTKKATAERSNYDPGRGGAACVPALRILPEKVV